MLFYKREGIQRVGDGVLDVPNSVKQTAEARAIEPQNGESPKGLAVLLNNYLLKFFAPLSPKESGKKPPSFFHARAGDAVAPRKKVSPRVVEDADPYFFSTM